MTNTFRSSFPTFRCYSYLAGTCLAIGYIASITCGGLGLLQICGLEAAFLIVQYYASPYIINWQYRTFHNAVEVTQGKIWDAADVVKGKIADVVKRKIAEEMKTDWKNIKVYSYKSHEPNAFAVGMTQKTAAVYVSTGLLATLGEYKRTNEDKRTNNNTDQSIPNINEMLEGVIAHEFGHITGRHAMIGCLSRSLLIMIDGIEAYLAKKEECDNKNNYKNNNKTECEKGTSFYAARSAFALFKFVGISAVSRQNEYMADNFAVSLGYGTPLKHALISLHNEIPNSVKTPKGYFYSTYSWFMESFASHPSLKNRVIAILEAEKEVNSPEGKEKNSMSIAETATGYIYKTYNAIYVETMSHFKGVDPENGCLI